MSSLSEFEAHASIVAWLGYALPPGSIYHHSPNEGLHHVRYRTKLKKLGLQTGWPDLELLVPIDYWFEHGTPRISLETRIYPDWGPIYLEVKSDKGRLSKAQKTMLALLDKAGGHTATVRSIDETKAFLSQRIALRA